MNKYKKLELKDFGVKREERILKNGCRVVLYEKKNSPLDMSVKFHAGSRFDPVGKEGLAHFTEHMLIAGSENFKSKDLISMFLERYGGSFGLYTNNSIISINADIGEMKDVDILITFLNEVINRPLFSSESFKTERGSIINEIGNSKNSPWKILGEAFSKILYKNTPVEKNNLGTEETVQKIIRKDIINYYEKNITPKNCTIVASGEIKIDELVKKIEQKIKFKNTKEENPINKNTYTLPEKGDSVTIPNKLSNQTLVIVGYRVGSDFEYSTALEVLGMILANGKASRLKKKLRYEKGLIYGVSASYNTYQDVGSFSINTTTSEDNVDKVLKIILDEIENIKKSGVTKEELDFVKDKMYKSTKKDFQTSEDWVSANSSRESLCKDGKTQIDFINKMMRVTDRDIVNITNKYLLKKMAFVGLYSKNK